MWFVKMSIPGDQFCEAMEAVSGWFAAEHINSSHFCYSRNPTGEIKFRISFSTEGDADRFAARFDGCVLSADLARD